MTQNTSSAVMQQRREPSDSFDYYPTPLWATRALCEFMMSEGLSWTGDAVHEPACGEGHMVRALQEYFGVVMATDIQPFGFGGQHDYLFGPIEKSDFDWIITNPPFKLAEEFILRALQEAKKGVAMLVRLSFLEGMGRYERLFSKAPPTHVLQFVERVAMVKGRVDKDASSATSYCWMIWDRRRMLSFGPAKVHPTEIHWISPCRKRLERVADYPEPESREAAPAPLFETPKNLKPEKP